MHGTMSLKFEHICCVTISDCFSGGHRGAGVSDVTSFTHAHNG